MSILTLLITFLSSLFKSQRQLVLENLALRQQVTMLRQSVKRLRATAADRMFCSKRDVNKRKQRKQPDALDEPVAKPLPQALCRSTSASSTSGSTGVTGVSPPLWGHAFFHNPQHSRPRVPEWPLIVPDQGNSHRRPQLSATRTRAATCGVLCPGGITLPMAWPMCSPVFSYGND